MNNLEIEIFGRKFNLDIIYDCFDNEKITEIQRDTFLNFISQKNILLEKAQQKLKEYLSINYKAQIGNDVDNIFRYIKPQYVYIKRSVTQERVIALLCSFKFDLEHGLAIIIKNEKEFLIGAQDIIL
ncbi:MAG: hypothetical protein IJQ07_06690 [Clostridia bacterium]|nr:hypothetical protein [Clostridia bacterium]